MTYEQLSTLTDNITDDALQALLARKDAAHADYSAAYHDREDREQELNEVMRKRPTLAARRASAIDALGIKTKEAFTAAVEGNSDFDKKAAYVIGNRAAIRVIDQCLANFDVVTVADAHRAVLAGKLHELESLYTHELLRRDCHVAETMHLLGKVSEQAGQIEINGVGSISEAIEEAAAHVFREIEVARDALASHEAVTRSAREEYQRGYENV
jgi:hypothetical protein